MDESQSSTKQRNGALSRLDRNNKYWLSGRSFVDGGVSAENELRRSGRVAPGEGFTMPKVVHINLFKLQFKLMILLNCILS